MYVPTRSHNQLQLRVRSSTGGRLRIQLNRREYWLEGPRVSRLGLHFYRHTFTQLASQTHFRLEAHHPETGAYGAIETATLPSPPGPPKLRVGVLADLHLPTERRSIDQYRPGTKRLYGLAQELGARYLQRLETLGADAVVLLGDVVDPCTDQTLHALQAMMRQVKVPCYPIIGNHEPWSRGGERRFYQALGLPDGGYYSARRNGVRMLMLSTPAPDAVGPGSAQLGWLKSQLRAAPASEDVVVFSHFSLLLHPCVQGVNDDGYQLLDNHQQLLELLAEFGNVRVFAAGHKNVPSLLVHRGVVHTLSPQLIQAPCGYDLLQFYHGGVARTTFEIDEQHYCEVARAAYADRWLERYGTDADRNFSHGYGSGAPGDSAT